MALSSQTVLLCNKMNSFQTLPILPPPTSSPISSLHQDLLQMFSLFLSLKCLWDKTGGLWETSHLYSQHHVFIFYSFISMLRADSVLHRGQVWSMEKRKEEGTDIGLWSEADVRTKKKKEFGLKFKTYIEKYLEYWHNLATYDLT